jgi:hypothetical protein
MRPGAGPRIVFGSKDHASPHWVPFNITDSVAQMIIVENAGIETSLPEVTGETVLPIKCCRIRGVSIAKGIG